MLGCNAYNTGEETNSSLTENLEGMISFLTETVDTNVDGFLFEVRDPSDNSLVASKYKNLEPMTLPSRLLDGAGPDHRFADAYFVLEPGEYLVQAFPMEGVRCHHSEECEPSNQELVVVDPGRTTEVFLISQCDTIDNGGLDIVAVLNYSPIITDLIFDPSKFFEVCETIFVWVVAHDPDGDPLTYYWELIEGPDCALAFYEDHLSFTVCECADYVIKVTVCDSFGLCAELSFPLHAGCGV
jgi:hypothetical protein